MSCVFICKIVNQTKESCSLKLKVTCLQLYEFTLQRNKIRIQSPILAICKQTIKNNFPFQRATLAPKSRSISNQAKMEEPSMHVYGFPIKNTECLIK